MENSLELLKIPISGTNDKKSNILVCWKPKGHVKSQFNLAYAYGAKCRKKFPVNTKNTIPQNPRPLEVSSNGTNNETHVILGGLLKSTWGVRIIQSEAAPEAQEIENPFTRV